MATAAYAVPHPFMRCVKSRMVSSCFPLYKYCPTICASTNGGLWGPLPAAWPAEYRRVQVRLGIARSIRARRGSSCKIT
jgi:hypothetical protein